MGPVLPAWRAGTQAEMSSTPTAAAALRSSHTGRTVRVREKSAMSFPDTCRMRGGR